MKPTITVKQAAKQASVSTSLIYSLLKSGRLKALRIGCRGRGKWLIEEEVFAAFVETCKAGIPSPATQPPLRHLR